MKKKFNILILLLLVSSLSCKCLQKRESTHATNTLVEQANTGLDNVNSAIDNCYTDKNSAEYKLAKQGTTIASAALQALRSDNAELQKNLKECNSNYLKEVRFATVGKVASALFGLGILYLLYRIVKKFIPGL